MQVDSFKRIAKAGHLAESDRKTTFPGAQSELMGIVIINVKNVALVLEKVKVLQSVIRIKPVSMLSPTLKCSWLIDTRSLSMALFALFSSSYQIIMRQ